MLEYPLVLPVQPDPPTYGTSLYRLLEHGLIGDQEYKGLEIGDFIKELYEFVYSPHVDQAFNCALGAYFSNKYSMGVFRGDASDDMGVQECVQQAKKKPLDKKYWSEMATDTWMHIDNVRQWEQYRKLVAETKRLNQQSRDEFVAARLEEFDFNTALDKEAALWDWNPLFHYCALNPKVRQRLSPLPWRHDRLEAEEAVQSILTSRTRRPEIPPQARLLKIYVHCKGLRDRY